MMCMIMLASDTVKKAGLLCVLAALLFALTGTALLYSGIYPMGADVPHHRVTYWLLETLRERSIARASAEIRVPELNVPERLLAGAADYDAMCTGCHLQPGKHSTDLALGLYPAPPDLTRAVAEVKSEVQARRHFWIIKHGIKASGMPAWGLTHDDERIWNMVAFLQRLPELTPAQYQIMTAMDMAVSDDEQRHEH